MNWSSEWNSGVPGVWPEVKPTDVVIGPTHDGNVWTRPTTLSIPIEGEWPRTVEAIQIGDLAVHEDLKFAEKQWQVTHVPTLTRFNAVPIWNHTQAALIEWCKKVQASNVEDWKCLKELTHDTYKSRSGFKDRIMNLCQNTEV